MVPVIMEPVLYIDRVELSSAIVRVRVAERTTLLLIDLQLLA